MLTVILGEGLEEIGEGIFCECTSLQEILILQTFKMIEEEAFYHCSQLKTVKLGDGLEEIGAHHYVRS